MFQQPWSGDMSAAPPGGPMHSEGIPAWLNITAGSSGGEVAPAGWHIGGDDVLLPLCTVMRHREPMALVGVEASSAESVAMDGGGMLHTLPTERSHFTCDKTFPRQGVAEPFMYSVEDPAS
ncbi:hypothetical protein Vafri_4260 [Volvox africanus]|uniref:Uncharacterized protein n=1 Tax=Volvox africanus TaxID=51714 RepID=A0A8J4EUQ2_9CHLO|nr:hypothetical protein Vafri_4260 [Volvox africanus]